MNRLTPCVWFTKDAGVAIKLYASAFKNLKIHNTTYFGKAMAEASRMQEGQEVVIDFEIAGYRIQLLNGGPYFEHTPATSLFVTCGSCEELDHIYNTLSKSGKTLMELGEYPFSKRYAFFADPYGVHWQLFLDEGAKQKVTPCLLFGGDKQGLGPQVLNYYLTLFKDTRVLMDERYKKGENGIEGSIKHARILLDGSELIIMDAGNNAPMKLTGGISLIANCKDQKEVDYFWDTICKTGQEVQCGWCIDQFGVTWQVVPEGISNYVFGPDKNGSERAAKAMMQMKKLDINKIREAYRG